MKSKKATRSQKKPGRDNHAGQCPKTLEAFRYEGKITYVWFRDHAAGRRNVFTVLALNGDGDPVVIGRELPSAEVLGLVIDCERTVNSKGPYYGNRSYVLRAIREVQRMRQDLMREVT